MPAFVHHITTLTPPFAYHQDFARDRLKDLAEDERTKRLIHAIYRRSGIVTRHSVYGDFLPDAEGSLFKFDEHGTLIPPTTGERNSVYAEWSRKLAVDLAGKLLAEVEDFTKDEVTHLIFASCTGFMNPGPDFHIIRELGLPQSVERYTLGFMGCYAAFPALRMAAQFCEANPDAVVLVMCLELCSLHMQSNAHQDTILANSLFADGAAAAIVSARSPAPKQPSYRLDGFVSSLVAAGEADMAWDIGDQGFNIVLSSYIPDIIQSSLRPIVEDVFQQKGLVPEDIDAWAVHPGGRAILDKVEQSLSLPATALETSRQVLRDYGNMSSATVLFVLKQMLADAGKEDALTCAIAFGPGLTVETALLTRLGVSSDDANALPMSAGAAYAEHAPAAPAV
ncbi:putative naringenin-chalcone synthase [Roseimicrobium gellanilyticum]|uniref:Putative naringenin-chalcone synthase n=1 Tax=Roseimicrobium gellanilyticum TaxID=748857 RepID=A0A366HA18_9BACT|nr:type III polyketide synthase [Roseimicrobium gellanilyticum]RBP38526.1 putative naringenin-chalcone synthase [Roseimicrobium gellanilyticum]